jgi:bacteriorhodopsin
MGERSRTWVEWLLYGIGLIATIIVTIYITKIAQNALNQKIK